MELRYTGEVLTCNKVLERLLQRYIAAQNKCSRKIKGKNALLVQTYRDKEAESWIGRDGCEVWYHYSGVLSSMITEED